jgi:hypothetical protein
MISWGMTLSRLNKKSVIRDYKEGYEMYSEKAKQYFPKRHIDKWYWQLAKYSLQEAKYYKHMIAQVESIGDEPLEQAMSVYMKETK